MTLAVFVLAILSASLPNAVVTPGVVRSLTKEQVCAIRWGRDRRHVTEAMKRQVAANYGMQRDSIRGKGVCCEIDHAIPRELAGDDVVRNLWPQPWAGAHVKDRAENEAHRRVCRGDMTLVHAQQAFATDWVSFNRELFPGKP